MSFGVEYAVKERFFPQRFLIDLVEELKWIEKNYQKEFIENSLKRDDGKEVEE
jgi:hypothetical protein